MILVSQIELFMPQQHNIKKTTVLLARSYTELAMLYIIHYDRETNQDCIKKISQILETPIIYTI